MELPVRLLERFRDPFDCFNDFQALQKLNIDTAGIADETQNGDLSAFGNMDIQIHIFQPCHQMGGLTGGSAVL